MELNECYDIFMDNVKMFGYKKEDFIYLRTMDIDDYVKESNIYLVAGLLKKITDYAWFYANCDIDEFIEGFEIVNDERYRKVYYLSEACYSFVYELLDNGCKHPVLLNFNNILQARCLFDNVLGAAVDFASCIDNKEISNQIKYMVDILTEDIITASNTDIKQNILKLDYIDDKELLEELSTINCDHCIKYAFLMENSSRLGFNKLDILGNKKANTNNDIFLETFSDKGIVLSNLLILLGNLSEQYGDVVLRKFTKEDIVIEGLEELIKKYMEDDYADEDDEYDYDEEEAEYESEIETYDENGNRIVVNSVEELRDYIYEQILKTNSDVTVEDYNIDIQENFRNYKAYQYKSTQTVEESIKVLDKCKKM